MNPLKEVWGVAKVVLTAPFLIFAVALLIIAESAMKITDRRKQRKPPPPARRSIR